MSNHEDLLLRLPMPLAQLYRRALNARTPLERHQAAYYLWEASLKLLGSVAIVEYLELGDEDPALAERLRNLARPALGHWWEFARRLTPVLAEAGDEPFGHLRQWLLGRSRDDLPRAAALDGLLLELGDGKPRARNTVRLSELFDRLVKYRSDYIGHGAAGQQATRFYERMGRGLLAGVSEILAHVDPLAGRRLIYVASVQRLGTGHWLVEQYELRGESACRLESFELSADQPDRLPTPECVYLAAGGGPGKRGSRGSIHAAASGRRSGDVEGRAEGAKPGLGETGPRGDEPGLGETGPRGAGGSLRLLHPLLIYEAETGEVFYLNSTRKKRRAEYLCYSTGRILKREQLLAEQRALLARVLGQAVDEAAVDDWQTQSQADEPPGRDDVPDEAPRMIGEFELISRIGRGGMGVVYRAWQPSLGRQVALKCLLRTGDPKAEARFAREIRTLGRVDHPHLVRTYTSGAEADQWFYAMELIEGADLGSVCQQLAGNDATQVTDDTWRQALTSACERARSQEESLTDSGTPKPAALAQRPDSPLESSTAPSPATGESIASATSNIRAVPAGRDYIAQVVEIVRQTAEAAHSLHESGIIHRDIKPGNIMLSRDGSHVVLMDLGLAQLADDMEGRLTRTRQFVGTLRYASPEQVLGVGNLDCRSDIYSLGATLWELLTLRPLYGATDQMPTPELMVRIQETDPDRPRKHNPRIPGDLEAIVRKCLSRERSRRYPTAAQFAEDLARWQRGEPVAARPPTLGYVLGKYARRHRAALVAAVLLVVCALAGTVGSFLLIRRQRDAAVRSEHAAIEAKDDALAQQMRAERAKNEAEAARGKVEELVDFNRIGLAYAALRANDFAGASWHLEECSPRSRGWEWRYCHQLAHPELATFRGHEGAVLCIAYSPDGRRVASGSMDGTVRVWDVATGEAPIIFRQHAATVYALAFDPSGGRIASGGQDGTVIVWAATSGEVIHRMETRPGRISSLAFSPDGFEIASTTVNEKDSELEVREVSSGTSRFRIPVPDAVLLDVQFAPSGDLLATAGTDSVVVWDTAEARPIGTVRGEEVTTASRGVVLPQPARSYSIRFHPFGPWLASGWSNGRVRLHYTERWRPRNRPLDGEIAEVGTRGLVWRSLDMIWPNEAEEWLSIQMSSSAIVDIRFSWDGHTIAAASNYELSFLQLSEELDWSTNHQRPVTFSPGNWGAVVSTPMRRQATHAEAVLAMDLSPGAGSIAFAGREGHGAVNIAQRFDVENWSPVSRGQHIAFNPDGRKLALAGREDTRVVLDVATGEIDVNLEVAEDSLWATCVAFSPDGQWVACGEGGRDGGCIRVWNARDGRIARSYSTQAPVRQIAISSADGTLVALDRDGVITLLNLKDPVSARVLDLGAHEPQAVSLSPAGDRLATAGNDQTVQLWEFSSGRNVKTFRGHGGAVDGVRFGPDGTWLASSGGEDRNELIVWDAATAEERFRLPRIPGAIQGFDLSPDGERIATVTSGQVRIWDGATGFPILALQTNEETFGAIRYSPSGDLLAFSNAAGQVTFWEVPENRDHLLRVANRVEELSHELVLAQDVAEAIQQQEDLTDRERTAALRMLRGRFVAPEQLQQRLWDIASDPTASSAAYRYVLRMGRACALRWPEEAKFGLAVAAAQLRLGQYEPCIATLKSLDATSHDSLDAQLILAMAQWKLERYSDAIATLESVRYGRSVFAEELPELLGIEIVSLQVEASTENKDSPTSVRARIICSSGFLAENVGVELAINGELQRNASRTLAEARELDFVWKVDCLEGNYQIARAVAKVGEFSVVEAKRAWWRAGQAPRLHLLVLAADEYRQGRLRFAVSDARAFQGAMEGSGYRQGERWTLVDKQLTRTAVLDAVEQVQQKLANAAPDDLLIVFFSGHGGVDKDSDRFFLVPSDFDWTNDRESRLSTDAISWQHLRQLAQLPCRVMFILDASNSGKAVELEKRREQASGVGDAAFLVLAACGAEEGAHEREETGGLFTHGVVKGLMGAADGDADGTVDSDELVGFVLEAVPRLAVTLSPSQPQTPACYASPKWKHVPLTTAEASETKSR